MTGRMLRAWLATAPPVIPLPASGATAERFHWIAEACALHASVGKLFESHCDALAILDELGAAHLADLPEAIWGVWAAEGPAGSRVEYRRGERSAGAKGDAQGTLHGRKSWCSGANAISHALITAWDEAGQSRLVAVRLDAPGVQVTREGWSPIGMRETGSVDVSFSGAAGVEVGRPGAYVERRGFWHGAAGIAACWYGIASAIATPLRERAVAATKADPLLLAQLGEVDAALLAARCVIRDAAATIDARPADFGQREAMAVRAVVEANCEQVMTTAGRALGAYALCRSPEHAQRVVDLSVFLRQSHGDRDLAALGGAVVNASAGDWRL